MSQTRTSKHQLVVASVAGIFVLVLGAPLAFALVFGLMTGWIVSVAAGALVGVRTGWAGLPRPVAVAGDLWAVGAMPER